MYPGRLRKRTSPGTEASAGAMELPADSALASGISCHEHTPLRRGDAGDDETKTTKSRRCRRSASPEEVACGSFF
jgi:hypothetical protein